MRNNRFIQIIAGTALGVAATLPFAAAAGATSTTGDGYKSDPPGANGTVKIDGRDFDEGIDNEPHVTCEFQVKFFDFDRDERANIVFTVQPPTGSGKELLRRDNVLISKDAAGGGKPDPDEVFAFSADDLQLSAFTPHPKQGYHVKLTVEQAGHGAGKHKVFWIRPCTAQPSTPSGSSGGAGGGPALPVTGAEVGGIVLVGVGLVAGGGALLVARRRRATRFVA